MAALAPVNPQLAYQYGIWLAVIALLTSGRMPRLGPVDCLAVLLCVWATATSMWTQDQAATEVAVYAWWTVALLLLAARHVMNTRRRLLLVAVAFLAGTTWAAIELISVGGTTEPSLLRQGIDGVGINYTAYSLATGMVVSLMLWAARTGSRTTRTALLLAVPVLGYATVITGTRASLIAVILVALYVFVNSAVKQAWVAAVAVSAVLLLAVPFSNLGQYSPGWLDDTFDRPLEDLSGRLLIWPIAEASFWESPLLGIGAGAFPGTNPYYGVGAHSLLLALGNDVGIVGIAIFVALIGFVLRDAAPATGKRNRMLVGALIVAWTPIWLSGHWEISPAAWLVLAVWSRLPLAVTPRRSPRRHRRADEPPLPALVVARGDVWRVGHVNAAVRVPRGLSGSVQAAAQPLPRR
ncbi:O-antigen ligase family protein [Micromonospora musae]|uniref:O-antigen ligase family protein n=1 Tax=Micromonospora musae TaxID=1894970 RepID=UPI0034301D1D